MGRAVEVRGFGELPLVAREFGRGPAGRPGALLLHGLMGHAGHWEETGRWLASRFRAVALDQRGHGRSGKPPGGPFDGAAFVADAEAVVERLGLAPVLLVGHGMGALTAWRLAARRPDLVRALVICEMRASAIGDEAQRRWRRWLGSWPLPFSSVEEVRAWFGERDPSLNAPQPARGWFFGEVMARRPDGWRPVFSRDQILEIREGFAHDAHWEELAEVPCPTLVVRGVDGELGRAEAQEMVRALPHGRYADVPGAGHLPQRERPSAWRETLRHFVEGALIT
ncbi:alpha/beta fold hydrolase [Streptomyces sp. 3MP-14]|uniref:Alpha/beta fold hydrolase n=1 Tax=Streptomyces mimosae TaxID=2586635 RepID=A0A5N6A877_9ACTN|nr:MULTISPECIES: alpha/beta hydrolase [Streptomyces]KAB8164203.1 alpha/beta fold hydrolase [Streptomyces mimosae]KAB8176480.1 alpha/beta fold hydrolase [Streptomyces sp. 3MP-14]